MGSDDATTEDRLLLLENRLYVLENMVREVRGETTSPSYVQSLTDFFGHGIRSPMFQSYMRYALTSVERGRKLIGLHALEGTKGIRYLDVGCAYGGAPIAMVEAGGELAVGFDVDERLIDLARRQAEARGVADRTEFMVRDITQAESVRELGKFDLITCIDVLEHVSDAAAAIRTLHSLLAHGATLVADVPNPHAVDTIEKDPHHHLFGSSLLDREEAIRVFEADRPGNAKYTVGVLHPLEWYEAHLHDAGFEINLTDDLSKVESRWPSVREGMLKLPERFEQVSADWPGWRRGLVGAKLDAHMARFRADLRARLPVATLFIRYGLPVHHRRLTKQTSWSPPQPARSSPSAPPAASSTAHT